MNKIYTYKGKLYEIFLETKSKVNGVWTDWIIYQCLYENHDGMFWGRSKEEFFELFKEVG